MKDHFGGKKPLCFQGEQDDFFLPQIRNRGLQSRELGKEPARGILQGGESVFFFFFPLLICPFTGLD